MRAAWEIVNCSAALVYASNLGTTLVQIRSRTAIFIPPVPKGVVEHRFRLLLGCAGDTNNMEHRNHLRKGFRVNVQQTTKMSKS